tara:strand:+ start:75 stop:1418 length:1344 start_codon:yes stop_codon:yes gene_type:complete
MNNLYKFKNIKYKFFSTKYLNNIGLKIFQTAVLLLASAPFFSFILFLISSFIGSHDRDDGFFKDKYNWPLVIASIFMIVNSCLITSNLIDIPEINESLVWIGLLNWLPFFWCFWSFQKFLVTKKLRSDTAKLFLIGSFPVLISGFCQYFLGLYGPYRFLNNLITWYQRPLNENEFSQSAVTGLFNNPNYAGAWLAIIFPICLGLFLIKNKNILLKYSYFLIIIFFIAMIILTTSRSAILAMLLSCFLFSRFNKFKIFSLLTTFFLIFGAYKFLIFMNIDIKALSNEFLPNEIYNKLSTFNLSNLSSLPRIDIWSKTLMFISNNILLGYGAGSFSNIYESFNGSFGDIQHSHNIFLELTFNYGILVSILILFPMIYLLISTSRKLLIYGKEEYFCLIEKAWIISFASFLLIHMFDLTYFDGRISLLCWTLLAGLRSMTKEDIQNQSSL